MKTTKLLFLLSLFFTALIPNFSSAGVLPTFNMTVKNIRTDPRPNGSDSLLYFDIYCRHTNSDQSDPMEYSSGSFKLWYNPDISSAGVLSAEKTGSDLPPALQSPDVSVNAALGLIQILANQPVPAENYFISSGYNGTKIISVKLRTTQSIWNFVELNLRFKLNAPGSSVSYLLPYPPGTDTITHPNQTSVILSDTVVNVWSVDEGGTEGSPVLMHSPFGRHKCQRGAHYCLCSGGICWKDIFLDEGPPSTEFGTIRTSVISNSAGVPTSLRMVFLNDPQPINGNIPVDSNEILNTQISNALGFKHVIMHSGDYHVDYSQNQYGEIVVEAEFVNYSETAAGSPFGRHKCVHGAHYCLCSGGVCWKDIFHMSDENVSELLDYGWYALTVENNSHGVSNSIRIRFLNDPQPTNGYLSVDTTELGSEISNELGYGSVVLLEGDYYVDYSNNEYGEIIVPADLSGPVKTLSLKVIPEGYLSNITNLNIEDKSVVYLRSASAPFAIADADTVTIDSLTFSGNCYFYNASAGNYYIDVKHRNSIETWSSNTVSISNTTASYDFTNAASQAYGNNMNLKLGKYCTFSGDVNQDGVIDLSDITDVFNDASSFITGYVVTDLTGDNLVDLSDLTIAFNNSSAFVSKITP